MRSCAIRRCCSPAPLSGMALTYLAPPLLALFGQRRRAAARPRHLGPDGGRVPADLAVLPAVAAVGARAACYCARSTCSSPSIPPTNMCAARAAAGRGASQANRVGSDDDDCDARIAIRQGPPGREFPGRLAADRVRATAAPSWRSTNSCASPTTSPITRRCAEPRSSRCSIASKPACSARTTTNAAGGARCAPRSRERSLSPRHAQDLLDRVPHGRDQAALRDWDDLIDYCTLFGHAGRPLRARRARREPRRPGRPTTRCAPRCRSSITCRTAARIIAISIASIFRSMRSPRPAPRSRRSARRSASPALRDMPAQACRAHRRAAATRARRSPAQIADSRLALEVAVIQTLARRLVAHAARRAIR